MKGKIFWYDTETTGIDSRRHAMVQLAGLLEIDGAVVEEIDLLFRPPEGRIIDPRALAVNGRTEVELDGFPELAIGIGRLKEVFGRYVSKYDRADKFVPAGFNINFDQEFLREGFRLAGDKYGPGSWLFNAPLDVRSWVALAVARDGLRLPDYKLTSVCAHYRIVLDNAHDALADVRATRELFYRLAGGAAGTGA